MPPALVELPLPRAIYQLAWPATASMLLVNVFNLVDAFWVGRLGTAALGGMTASAFVVWCLHAVGQLVGTGVNAVVARRVGEGLEQRAGVAAGHGLLLAVGLALAVMALTLPAQDWVLDCLGLTPAVHRAAAAYLAPILWGFPAIPCWYAVEAIFRGSGDTRTPMKILGATLLLNTLIDPLLIFGWGPVPALGIAGAAWATVLTHLLGVVAAVVALRHRSVRPRLGAGPAVDGALVWTLVRVGTPIAVSSFLFSVIYIVLTRIIAPFGGPPLAALGVGHRVEGLAYFTCLGFAAAASTLVGQQLGAGRPELAERAGWLSTGYTAGIVLGLSVLYLAAAPWIYRLFSPDPALMAEGAAYLRIVALLEVGMAFELVLEGAFAGAGSSIPPMLVCVPLTALRIPGAYLLSRGQLGTRGIYWAISVSTGLKGLVLGLWFRLNTWKKTRV
jgi:putative MATE family efflux protein